jgi:hypothetical protein
LFARIDLTCWRSRSNDFAGNEVTFADPLIEKVVERAVEDALENSAEKSKKTLPAEKESKAAEKADSSPD